MNRYLKIDGRKIPLMNLEKGIWFINEFIRNHLADHDDCTILGAARSSSGKGQIIKGIQNIFQDDVLHFCLDDYYYGEPKMSELKKIWPDLTWDDPRAVELDLAAENLLKLKKNEIILNPCYSKETARRKERPREVTPRKIKCVEGNYSFTNEILRNEADLKIFIISSKHSRLVRRLLRDQFLEMTPSQSFEYVLDVAEPMGDIYIDPTMKYADIIIQNELIPELECENCGMFQQQIKFRSSITPEKMRRLGAEHLISTRQVDKYYNCSDDDIFRTDQIVRIRNEGNSHWFTIKGPRHAVDCERPIFEFPISYDASVRFPEFYGREVLRTEKYRTLYHYSGVIVAVDSDVTVTRRKRQKNLGDFVEVRLAHLGDVLTTEKITNTVKFMNLSMENAITDSYVKLGI